MDHRIIAFFPFLQGEVSRAREIAIGGIVMGLILLFAVRGVGVYYLLRSINNL